MYQVEQIVGKRIDPLTNMYEYYVKWVNYPPQQNTWQPERNLKFVKNLIQEFNNKNLGTNDFKKQMVEKIKGGNLNKNNRGGVNNYFRQDNNYFRQDNNYFRQDNNYLRQDNKYLRQDNKYLRQDSQDQIEENIFFQEESENQQKQKYDSNFNEEQMKQNKKGFIKKNQIQNFRNDKNKINCSFDLTRTDISDKLSKESLKYKKPILKNNSIIKNQIEGFQKPIIKQDMPWQRIVNKRVPPPPPPYFSVNKPKNLNYKIEQTQITHQFQKLKSEKILQKKKPYEQMLKKLESQQYIKSNKIQQNTNNFNQFKAFKQQIKRNPPPPPTYLNQQKPMMGKNLQQTKYNNVPQFQQNFQQYQKQSINQNPIKYFNSYSNQYQIAYTNDNNDYQLLQNNQKFTNILCILKMDKKEDAFIYLAETDKGQIWLTRQDVVPKFSTALVEFYQKYITFND